MASLTATVLVIDGDLRPARLRGGVAVSHSGLAGGPGMLCQGRDCPTRFIVNFLLLLYFENARV